MRAALALLFTLPAAAQFKATTNLQQVAVQVTDKQNHAVHALTAADFTLSENGHPQKIAFFGAESEPVSLSILLDSSDSMKASHKLDRARAAIRAILHAIRAEDQIALIPFTDRTGNFIPLTPAERQDPPQIRVPSNGTGTALYDALATTLCHMRTSQKMKQALIVITDGADQSSRLRIEQLIAEAHTSKPEIFMIGFWSRDESDDYRTAGPTLTLVNGHQIDNPIQVFARISRETGAESFFPASDHDLEQVLQRILEIVQGQYTLSYYLENVDAARKIQVKVDRKGVTVTAPRSISAETPSDATSCEVSKADHPYPWEPLVTHAGETIYRDDFSNPSTGWPNHRGARYQAGVYEMAREVTPSATMRTSPLEGNIAAYGPWWHDFKATLTLDEKASNGAGEGLVFRLNQTGCYTLLVTHLGKPSASFKLAKRTWQRGSSKETILIDWTAMPQDPRTTARLTVECKGDQTSIWLNDVPVTKIKDPDFLEGQVGMAQFGYGRVLFHNLEVHGPP